MIGDVHVRFCEGLGVRFPRATHQLQILPDGKFIYTVAISKFQYAKGATKPTISADRITGGIRFSQSTRPAHGLGPAHEAGPCQALISKLRTELI